MIKFTHLFSRARLARDRSGMAAVEFALLLPVFLTLFIGSYEVSDLLLTFLKLEAAAETAADLVAQTDVNGGANGNGILQDSDFTNITNAVQQVMTPLPTANLKIAYASITFNNATTAQLNWHTETPGATPISVAALPNGVDSRTMGTLSATSTDSVIVAQVTYPYSSVFSSYFNINTTLSEAKYNRPRYVACVPKYPQTACP
jgi:Flp pilus assembly protein TadG